MNKLPANQKFRQHVKRWKRYEKPQPGHRLQMDVKFLERIPGKKTDNGAEFQSKSHWHLDQFDIHHVYLRPRTPRLNGKVERSHRVDNQEFYQLLDKGGISDDIRLYNEKLREWENYYNYRPHSSHEDKRLTNGY